MATSYKTPGLYFSETDKSEVIASDGTSLGGTVIVAKKGPINRRVTITSDSDFVKIFGAPSAASTNGSKVLDWGYNGYAARAHLAGGGAVEIIRAASSADTFAGVGLTTSSVPFRTLTSGIPASSAYTDEDKYDAIYSIDNASLLTAFTAVTSASVKALFTLNGPGDNTEGYSVGIESLSNWADWLYAYDEYADVLATSATSAVPGSDGSDLVAAEIVKVYVYSTAGGTTPVETFYGSFNPDLIVNNESMYLPDVINGFSTTGLYLKVYDTTTLNTSAAQTNWKATSATTWTPTQSSLTLGASTSAAISSIAPLYNYFKTSNLGYIIDANPESSATGVAAIVAPILETVGNTLGIFQAGGNATAAATKSTYKSNLTGGVSAYNTSYSTSYTGFMQVRDVENAKFVWLPNAVTACYSNTLTDTIANVWDAPSGNGRGNVTCYDQLPIFDDTDIGALYDINYNCVKKFPGEGFILWGQKTRQRKKSALDRITTRKVLNLIKKTLATSLRPIVLNLNNTAGVRLRVQNNLKDYFDGIVSAGGLTAATAICDETNNTAQIIDNHILAISIVVQPVQTIEFVAINIIITRTGVSVTEALVA
jgi:phage tail sheath protein FI